jgi:uridine phosphorylase
MEEMAALGVRRFLAFGACGSLVERLPIGSVVIPTFAHPDEGTSRHYGSPSKPRPDRELVRALTAACRRRAIAFAQGGTWTVDAPYRESFQRARDLARHGILAVEMEASALWAVARTRGLRTASLFVVSDELGGDGWNPGFRHPTFLAAKKEAVRAVVDAISESGP